MPKRTDIRRILIVGSGPIVIGQACEFDYSGTQACKALRQEGYEVVLVNSNPATIMTDPEFADRTYVEPLVPEIVEKIIERDRPDALLPTVGGQTGLNVSVALGEAGVLDRYGVEMIGAKLPAVKMAEDRLLFKKAMQAIGLEVPRSGYASSFEEARAIVEETGYPAILRPSFTLGGAWGGTAYNVEELERIVKQGLKYSPVHQVLVEESVLGWKEYELEVMRDLRDNVVIICSIENFDPMGVHTGDSVTVAPAQTLSDREYQRMRDAAIAVIRAIGVETGGSNIQFAVNPRDGRMVVIEMNPRVSRSSALASKATGFPIAKIAAKLAVGYTLDEIPNDITRVTPSSFEPTIDYCVVKIPRWAFEKFPGADDTLGVSMKSVGEVMAIGRTFQEAFQKGIRSLEIGRYGFGDEGRPPVHPERVREFLLRPTPYRLYYIHYALRAGWSVDSIASITGIDPWFLQNLESLVDLEGRLRSFRLDALPADLLRRAKRAGFSDIQLGALMQATQGDVRARRAEEGIRPVFKRVDTCGAEFEALTPYLYSTYEEECEADPTSRRKVVILGSGPNRIGQGIEFDYACVHASFALREEGFETIMVNCNPETVSTDYDTSDRLYFEPLTLEDVLSIVDVEKPEGVIVQFGGQTPLGLAIPLHRAGVRILGTSPDSIDLAEDRKRFGALLQGLGVRQPEWGTALTLQEAQAVAERIGYPVLVRPSYVLGGRAMQIVYEPHALERFFQEAVAASGEHPVLIDRFLEDAFEIDVDAVSDGTDVVIAGIMQHIEEAGIHSGDSACALPPYLVSEADQDRIRDIVRTVTLALDVRGLINFQFAIQGGVLYVLEVNPRASRTVPFVSKATGIPWAKVAARVAIGRTLREQGITREAKPRAWFVKESVFPWVRFAGVDPILGPEMKSTGEVMGVAKTFGEAFAKSQIAAGAALPLEGTIFVSVNDNDKRNVLATVRRFHAMGFGIIATQGTAEFFRAEGLPAEMVFKVNEGRPHVVDRMVNGDIDLIINTPLGKESFYDETAIRKGAISYAIPLITTLSAAAAAVEAVHTLREEALHVMSLQELHAKPGSG